MCNFEVVELGSELIHCKECTVLITAITASVATPWSCPGPALVLLVSEPVADGAVRVRIALELFPCNTKSSRSPSVANSLTKSGGAVDGVQSKPMAELHKDTNLVPPPR